jgi:monofunctional biosynthetic peptidoglycan transglycosylase
MQEGAEIQQAPAPPPQEPTALPEATPGRKRWRRRVALGLTTAALLGLCGWSAHQALTWPDVAALRARNPKTTAYMERFAERQAAKGARPQATWRWVPYDAISPQLKRAVLVAEDIEFFSHGGFSFAELRQAVRDALSGRRELRGASTITQQLAKNLWLSPSRNPLRKIKEALLTWQLERELSKKRILELYLNVAEFGPGIYGVEAAARHYFGAAAAEVGERQAAELAAALPRPSRWHPGSQSQSYERYILEIQRRMEMATFLRRLVDPGQPPSRDSATTSTADTAASQGLNFQTSTSPSR